MLVCFPPSLLIPPSFIPSVLPALFFYFPDYSAMHLSSQSSLLPFFLHFHGVLLHLNSLIFRFMHVLISSFHSLIVSFLPTYTPPPISLPLLLFIFSIVTSCFIFSVHNHVHSLSVNACSCDSIFFLLDSGVLSCCCFSSPSLRSILLPSRFSHQMRLKNQLE